MAKAQSDTQEEVVQRPVEEKPTYYARPRTDTKTVVVAVGASVVLFVVGLILGYLLGHQTANNDSRGVMNGTNMMNGTFRNRLQTQSTTN